MKIHSLLATAIAAPMLLTAAPAAAQADGIMGEIMMVGSGYCPASSAEMAGAILQVQAYGQLFTLIGATYGGDGNTTFALPDLRGRSPIGVGQSTGTSNYALGQAGGTETTSMNAGNLPAHIHTGNAVASSAGPNVDDPTGAALADMVAGQIVYARTQPNVDMAPDTVQVGTTGNNQPFPIVPPYLALRYCVITQGIYPSQP